MDDAGLAYLMTAPFVPPEVDLRHYDFVPIFRRRLFASRFHRLTSPAEYRAGLILWLKSWDEVPAGSLPDNDRELCALAELDRDLREWRKVKRWALHGWQLCDDGRLYHPVVAEVTLEAWDRITANRHRTAAATAARIRHRDDKRDDQRNEVPIQDKTLPLSETQRTKPRTRGRENGHDPEGFSEIDPGPGGRSAPLRRDAPPLKATRKELLRQKLMRFAQATFSQDDTTNAFLGLMGEDPEHSAQWWLDALDLQMRKAKWDDTDA
jgi:hypothetical protein